MEEEFAAQRFDIQVTHRDPESGLVTRQNPYNLIVHGEARKRLWERPKNSGNVFDKKGNPCGRFVRDEKGVGKYDPFADHVEVKPELSSTEKAQQVLFEKDERILALEKELAAVKAEAKQSAPKQAKPKASPKADEV